MKKLVVKVGTSTISTKDEISQIQIDKIADFICDLKKQYEVILVSSGAVIAGYSILPLEKSIINKQALASIGQPKLMSIYKQTFRQRGVKIAQLLLTASSFDSRKQTLNAKTNIQTLLKHDVLPIINENDATVIKELIFGDNDQLSASVCHFFDFDLLVILSDINGYYDSDPSVNKNAKVIKHISKLEKSELLKPASPNHNFATGGILTKLKSANFLLDNDKRMFLTSGLDLQDAKSFLIDGKYKNGTLFSKINTLN